MRKNQHWASYGCYLAFLLGGTALHAQPVVPATHAARLIAGDSGVGAHFDLLADSSGSGSFTGFFYLEDERRLYSGSCNNFICSATSLINADVGTGKFVRAVRPPGNGGRPIVAFYDEVNGDLRLASCADFSCSFAPSRVLVSDQDVGQDIAIAISPVTGFAVISYYRANIAGSLFAYVCADAACTTGTVQAWDAALTGDRGRRSAVAFGANLGNVTNIFVVYENSQSGELKYGRSNLPYSTLSTSVLASGTDPAMSVGASGFPDIVYTGAGGSLVRLRCPSFDCVGAVPEVLSTTRGLKPSILRLADNSLYITSRDALGGVWGARCGAASSCVGAAFEAIESNMGAGPSISLQNGSTNNVVDSFYRDAARADLRASRCTTPACAMRVNQTVLRGIATSAQRVALRPDGRAVLAWIQQRAVQLAVCADTNCTTFARKSVQSANTDNSISMVTRSDGRPLLYYSYVGGSAAWDCADADCNSGALREITPPGSGTGSGARALALRSNGLPVMLYFNNPQAGMYLYLCTDSGCTAGTRERVFDAALSGTIISAGLAISAGDRPIFQFTQFTAGSFSQSISRCTSPACTSVARTDYPGGTFIDTLALAPNGNALLPINDGSNALLVCNNLDCTTATRQSLNGDGANLLRFGADGLPQYAPVSNAVQLARCSDASCAAAPTITPYFSSGLDASVTALALNSTNQPVLAINESSAMWLVLPQSDVVFKNGFE